MEHGLFEDVCPTQNAGVPIAILVELPIKTIPGPSIKRSPTRFGGRLGSSEMDLATVGLRSFHPWGSRGWNGHSCGALEPRSQGSFLWQLTECYSLPSPKMGRGNVTYHGPRPPWFWGMIYAARHCISKAKRRATDANSATLQRLSEGVTRSGLEIRGQRSRFEGMLWCFG